MTVKELIEFLEKQEEGFQVFMADFPGKNSLLSELHISIEKDRLIFGV